MTIAMICIGLLGLLVFSLGFGVSLTRGQTNTNSGYSTDPADRLYKWVRAHGNTTEYAPILAILILVSALYEPSTWAIWCMVIATAGRYSIVAGILLSQTLDKAHPLRFAGAIATYLAGFGLCADVLLSV